jgi:hypothetical protein
MELLNTILKKTFKACHFKSPDYYIDFLNIACLLGGVRNGIHLDYTYDLSLIESIVKEIHECKSVDFITRVQATTIWNTEKVTTAQAKHSWAFVGDSGKKEDVTYWANNSLLLGNDMGYPSYTMDLTKAGNWSLELSLNYDGTSQYPVSMMGGRFDKTKEGDLESILVIQKFLESLVSMDIYNPLGDRVYLETVKLHVK